MDGSLRPLRVAVVPARELAARARLFGALEDALPIVFEGREPGDVRDVAGVVAFGEHQLATTVPCLVAAGEERDGPGAVLEVAAGAPVDPVLRGARLSDSRAVPLAGGEQAGDVVLARLGGAPAWVRRGAVELVGSAPAELGEDEPLRDRLWPGRCLAALALVHFLRELAAEVRWERPPLQAAFVIDDPNLHWPTYGHVRYPELLRHAERFAYHVSVAMVPLDSWLVHPRVAGLFRRGSSRLSVCVHGNDHTGPELGRLRSDDDAVALAEQALRRADRFERRARVPVARVMVPPHERLSEPAARALLTCGFEGVCVTRPYPWTRQGPETPWLTRPADVGPLVAWRPAEIVAGGLPLMLRVPFGHAREDLVLRAFLGQPLVLYGHHGDLHGGLDLLAEAAAFVNRLGPVRWAPLDELTRGLVETRRSGRVLTLRPFARRIAVEVPEGVEEVHVDAGALGLSAVPPLPARAGRLELDLALPSARPAAVAPPRRIWPVARRLAGEGRDRMAAVLGS